MKELKYAEMIHNERFDIDIKPYLITAEIELIVDKILEQDNMIHRDIIKNMLVIKFCTNIENVDEMDYDLVVSSGLLSEILDIVENYYDIDTYVLRSESVENSVKKFLENTSIVIDKATKSMPKTPKAWEKMFGQLAEAVKKNDK